ncbi:putative polyprotein [Gregarina niphandrodes]|uniref:Polyprotein n=1 Tax=Gregarina niphandrodes TaxID=110365 RepID=A0A023AV85_GRENI|nr:putative polyprotein [Gregarina niphandrodes]EZG42694.1 putative polyprotein [Gregarina niphandrodes]|eukprot:XP_011134710.1 putative polyprotein [Gregarina niphandrodes]
MDRVFEGLIGNNVNVYIDHIVVYVDDLDTWFERLDEVLGRCCEEGLFLKLKKGEYVKQEAKLLGFIEEGIKPDPKKVADLMRVEAPGNVRELRSFLGSVTYLKRHIPQFASRVAGMTDLLKKKTEFVWSEAREEEFQAAPADIGEFVLTTDASDRAIGAILEQKQARGCVPIEFGSKKLDECQQRWDTRERELYGKVLRREVAGLLLRCAVYHQD